MAKHAWGITRPVSANPYEEDQFKGVPVKCYERDYFKKGTVWINNQMFPAIIPGEISHEKIVEFADCRMNSADCTVKYRYPPQDVWRQSRWRTLEPGQTVDLIVDRMELEVEYTGPLL